MKSAIKVSIVSCACLLNMAECPREATEIGFWEIKGSSGSIRIDLSNPQKPEVRRLVPPIQVTWGPTALPMVVQVYHMNKVVFPEGNPNAPSPRNISMALEADSVRRYEFKIWRVGGAEPLDTLWIEVIDE